MKPRRASRRNPSPPKIKQIFSLDLRSLALFRILLGWLVLSDLFVRAWFFTAHYTDFGLLPRAPLIQDFSSPWALSLHLMSGTAAVQAVLFLLSAVFALMLLFGYRTRLATLLSWIMMVSLHHRNPMVLQAGDVYFRMLLLWGFFLPLGEYFSIDDLRRPKNSSSPSRSVSSMGTAALLFQIAFVYWFTAWIKLSGSSFEVWWNQGAAVYHALSIDEFRKPFGTFLLHLPYPFLKMLNYGSILFEALAPLLLFVPLAPVRLLVVFSFILFHTALGLSLDLGPFSWVSSLAVVPLIPSFVWDKLPLDRLRFKFLSSLPIPAAPRPARRNTSLLQSALAAFLIGYVLLWNLGTVPQSHVKVPKNLEWIGVAFGLEQRWNMFSPPLREDGWYVIPAKLKNGKTVDFMRDGTEVYWDKPKPVYKTYRSERERKYMMNIWLAANKKHRLYFGKYLCRRWNSSHAGDEQVESFEIIFMKEFTPPYGQTPKVEKVTIWKHWCFKVPEGEIKEPDECCG